MWATPNGNRAERVIAMRDCINYEMASHSAQERECRVIRHQGCDRGPNDGMRAQNQGWCPLHCGIILYANWNARQTLDEDWTSVAGGRAGPMGAPEDDHGIVPSRGTHLRRLPAGLRKCRTRLAGSVRVEPRPLFFFK